MTLEAFTEGCPVGLGSLSLQGESKTSALTWGISQRCGGYLLSTTMCSEFPRAKSHGSVPFGLPDLKGDPGTDPE